MKDINRFLEGAILPEANGTSLTREISTRQLDMKIACLGWGSLIWRPGGLKIQRYWFNDGPFLPLEFARQSENGRLTLVINVGSKPVRSLWALMDTTDLNEAKTSLMLREGIKERNIEKHLGVLTCSNEVQDQFLQELKEWALTLKLDAILWTSLEPKFSDEVNRAPTLDEALNYLRNLDIQKRQAAEEYIRRAPQQIDTSYRQVFESEFGWTYLQ